MNLTEVERVWEERRDEEWVEDDEGKRLER
jgi:hypothetical protein